MRITITEAAAIVIAVVLLIALLWGFDLTA